MTLSKTLAASALAIIASLLDGTQPAAAADDTIYVYNWAAYIGTDTLENFTKETGIKVVYDTYDSAETLQAKLLAGQTGYDVVVHSASIYGPQNIEAGLYLKLDKSQLPNLADLDPELVKRYDQYDPGMQYTVPYLWTTLGFTYNVDSVKQLIPNAPLDSLAMLFDPEVVSKLKDCGVSFVDGSTVVMPMALSYLQIDPNSQNPDDYQKAKEMLSQIRQYVKVFDNSNYLTALPQKSICIAMTWSGDYATALANAASANIEVDLAYTVPKEGSALYLDALYIPADAKNVDGALKFINYLQRPDVMAGITTATNYANANSKATPLIDKAITGNPAIYPDAEIMKKTFVQLPLNPRATRAATRAFSDFKTAN